MYNSPIRQLSPDIPFDINDIMGPISGTQSVKHFRRPVREKQIQIVKNNRNKTNFSKEELKILRLNFDNFQKQVHK